MPTGTHEAKEERHGGAGVDLGRGGGRRLGGGGGGGVAGGPATLRRRVGDCLTGFTGGPVRVGAARPATATGPGRVAARPAPAAGPPLADLTDRPAGQRHGGAIPTGAGSSTVGRGRVSSASGMVEAGCAGSGTTAGRAGHAGGWTGRPGSPRPHLAGPGEPARGPWPLPRRVLASPRGAVEVQLPVCSSTRC
jgi:hypothetical protein